MSEITLDYLRSDKLKVGDKDVAIFVNKLCDNTKNMNLKQHREWYRNERFFRGEHWIVYNRSLNKIQTIPIHRGEIRRTINKIRSQVRGVKNFIKRSQPRWEVHPADTTDEALAEAIKKNKILQNIYRTRKIKHKLTDIIVDGLKYSVGILEGGIVKKDGKDYLDFWVDDTFEIYFDPYAPSVPTCRYIIKTVKRPLSSINNDKRYTLKTKIVADNRESSSEYKELLELEKYSRDDSKSMQDLETAIVKEVQLKWVEDDKTKVRFLTVIDNQFVRFYDTKYRRYPIFTYSPEKASNSIYSDAWIKDLISPNKSLDKTASQIEGYIQRMLAGKYLRKQGVEVTSITDKGAEIITYKGQVPPKQMDLQPLPAAPFQHVANSERWLEEMGGIREASLGRAPGSLQSGKAIEALQQADAQTVAEPIENLENFLSDVAEFCLEVIEDYTIVSEEIIEDGEKIKYMGNMPDTGTPEGTMRVKSGEVKVVIVPEIAYSEEMKKETLFKLLEFQMIDPQTILEKLQISNVGEVIERMQKHNEEKFKQDMVKQRESHRTDGNGPEDTADMADQENMQLSAGQPVNPTPRALWTPEHTKLHMAFIKENKDAYQQNMEMFDEHIRNEEQYINQ